METVDTGTILIKPVSVGNFGNNVFVLICKKTNDSVIVDASFEADKMLAAAEGTNVRFILMTHCHSDHTQALEELRSATGAPVGIPPAESKQFGIKADFDINDGDKIKFGDCEVEAFLAGPGHSPAGTAFLMPGHCIIGDAVFPGGPGRTNSSADFDVLLANIQKRVYTLPDETVLYAGHGDNTITVGESKKEYAVFASKERTKSPHGDVLWLES
jgi:glyoxylase-like metal-dependent hydrolase (beta-lactamase superfamily II)